MEDLWDYFYILLSLSYFWNLLGIFFFEIFNRLEKPDANNQTHLLTRDLPIYYYVIKTKQKILITVYIPRHLQTIYNRTREK